jgi:hypothetical protein
MNNSGTTLKIQTFGCFNFSMNGIPIETSWPNETVKELFCSLLSPLDLYMSWDRICRAILGETETRSGRRKINENVIKPLDCFLVKLLGFNPLIAEHEGIRIDQLRIDVDVFEFHSAIVDGLRLLTVGNHGVAQEKFDRANVLYAGSYLPGIRGKIIDNTRNDLESLRQTICIDAMPFSRKARYSGRNRRTGSGLLVTAPIKTQQKAEYGCEELLYQGYRVL